MPSTKLRARSTSPIFFALMCHTAAHDWSNCRLPRNIKMARLMASVACTWDGDGMPWTEPDRSRLKGHAVQVFS